MAKVNGSYILAEAVADDVAGAGDDVVVVVVAGAGREAGCRGIEQDHRTGDRNQAQPTKMGETKTIES
ncbi:uncharacterized protein N7515_008383 [Penicillium bovifimosum]|uniref:Uncharacterized protein n=1 Tax=Penicillium bovifimosum TaxID=126998 RepID=A0A9W9GN63_9EURO|nr:uncharacterized protein N7515_008383 [Penicillium bovifimosum]KAJ5124558.1 hypothetical protein N7515_008383 [Penicillium bovifimosum]